MSKFYAAFFASIFAFTANAANDGSVLVRHGQTVITDRDVQVALENFVPEKNRADVLGNEKRLRDFVAQLFALRKLADESKRRDLSADERAKIDAFR